MIQRSTTKLLIAGMAVMAATLIPILVPATAAAVDGSWNAFTAGTYDWDTAANWVASTIADGAGFTATFSGDSTGDITVELDPANRTIGNLTFSDSDPITTPAGWTIAGPGTLTLNNNATVPSITISSLAAGKMVTISATIAGANGLSLSGAGTVRLTAANTYTDGANNTNVGSGTILNLGHANAVQNSTVNLNDNNQLTFAPSIGTFNLGGLASAFGIGDIALFDGSSAVNLVVGSNAQATTYNGILSGGGSLTKVGTGTLTLAGINTYGGGTNLNGGTVSIASDDNIGGAASALNFNGGNLQITGVTLQNLNGHTLNTTTFTGGLDINDAGNTFTLSQSLSGSGALTKLGAGTLVLTGTNSYTGRTIVAAGILQGTTSSLQGDIANNATVAFNNTVDGTYAGIMSGIGAVTLGGTNTVTFSAANTYSGTTTINSGVLRLSNANAVQASTVNLTADNVLTFAPSIGTFNLGGLASDVGVGSFALFDGSSAVNLVVGANAQSTTYNGALSGGGSLTKIGAGTLTLTGTNTFSGGTNLNGGTVSIASDDNIGGAASTINFNGGILQVTGGTLLNLDTHTINAATFNGGLDIPLGNTFTVSQSLSGSGALTKSGDGTLVLSGTNSYGGGTTVSNGTLQGTTSSLQGNITNNGNVTFNNSVAGTYAGTMTGTGGATLSGPGTVTFSAANTYSGDTTINGGALRLSNASAVQNSTVNVNAANGLLFAAGVTSPTIGNLGGIENFGLTDGAAAAVTLTVGSNNASPSYSGTMTGSGGLTKVGSGTLTFSADMIANSGYTGTTTVNAGDLIVNGTLASQTLVVNGGSLTLNGNSAAQNVTVNAGTMTINSTLTAPQNLTLRSVTLTVGSSASGSFSTGTTLAANSSSVIDSVALSGTFGLGTLTQGSAGSAVNFATPTSGGHLQTKTANTAGSILGVWATANGTDWAVSAGNGVTAGDITAFSGYTNNTWGGGTDTTVTAPFNSPPFNNVTTHTLRFNAAQRSIVALNGNNVISSGGILVGTGVGNFSNVITGGTLTGSANGTLYVNQRNTANLLTISSTIVNNGASSGVSKAGPGILVLNGSNTYTGATNLYAGTLSISSDANLGAASNALNFNGGTLQVTGTGVTNFGSHNVNFSSFDGGIDVASAANTFTISQNITGSGALTKVGPGTLLLTGANNYAGDTTVLNGTLTFGANNPNVKLLKLGAVTTAANVNTALITVGTVNVNADVTTTGILVQTNNVFTHNLITIAPGKTLTVNSPVTVGYDTGSASALQPFTILNVTGNAMNIQGAGSMLTVGVNNSGTGNADRPTTLDLSGLTSFTFDGGATGEVRVAGSGATPGTGNRVYGLLNLANTSNTITAGAVTVGGGSEGGGPSTQTNRIVLGGGTNVINANNIYVGTFKSTGSMSFATASTLTNATAANALPVVTSGSLTVRGTTGGSSRANIVVGQTAVSAGTGIGSIDFVTHNVDILGNTLTLASKVIDSVAGAAGATTGTLTFNSGTIDINKLVMATRSNTNGTPGATGNSTATVTVGNNTFSGTALLKVGSGGFTIADNPLGTGGGGGAASASGTVNILTGGTLQSSSDILIGAKTPLNTYTATINLTGGTLDMLDTNATTRHNIGAPLLPINALNVTSGTLKDIGTIFTTTAANRNGVIKTGTGTLVLDGTNNYTGDTTIGSTTTFGGVVVVTGTTNQGTMTVNRGVLSGTGTVGTVSLRVLDSVSNPTLTASSVIDPGGASPGGIGGLDGQYGTLTVLSLGVNAAGSGTAGGIMRFDLTNTSGGPNDTIIATNAATFGANTKISLAKVPAAGTYDLLTLNSGTISGAIGNVSVLSPGSTRPGLSFTPQYNGGVNKLQLVVAGAVGNLTWSGETTTWNVDSATNWTGEKFYNLDNVTFADGPGPAARTVTLTAVQPQSVTVNNSAGNDYTFSGAGGIAGFGTTLTKSGSGTLTVGTSNTYGGATSISGTGTLRLNITGSIASTSSITIGAGSTLQLGTADATTGAGLGTGATAPAITNSGSLVLDTTSAAAAISNVITGSGSIVKNGTGTVTLNGNSPLFTGPITINTGMITLANNVVFAAGSSTSPNPITVVAGATLNLGNSTANTQYMGTREIRIAGDGSTGTNGAIDKGGNQQQNALQNLTLTANASLNAAGRLDVRGVNGPGSLNLANNTLTVRSGQFAIVNSTVSNGNITTIGAGTAMTLQGAIIQGTGTITINPTTGNGDLRLDGVLPGTVTRDIDVAGAVGTTVRLQLNSDNGANSPLFPDNPATLDSNITLHNNLTVGPNNLNAATSATLTLNGNLIQPDATPRTLTAGLMNGNATAVTVVLNGNNTFTGGLAIGTTTNTGTGGVVVQMGSAGALNASGVNALTFNTNADNANYGLRMNGFNLTTTGLSGVNQNPYIENASAIPVTLTVNSSAASSFPGVLRDGVGGGTFSLTKSGTGTLTLNNATGNTYTGTTTVNQGTLAMGAANEINNVSKLVLGGGKFATGGFNQTLDTLQILDYSAIDMSTSTPNTLQLADSSGTAWTAGTSVSIFNWTGTPAAAGTPGVNDIVLVGTNNSGLTAGQLSQVHFAGFNGAMFVGATAEVVPLSVSTRVLGDFNIDGTTNSADLPVMLTALTNIPSYMTAGSPLHNPAYPFALTNDDLLNIGDMNADGRLSNADMQPLLYFLVNGMFPGSGSGAAPVPEPSTLVLVGLGLVGLLAVRRRKAR